MLQEQKRVRDAAGAAVLDERALERQRVLVGNEAGPAEIELTPYAWFGSKCSRCCLMSAMNWSATAPSIKR